MTMLRASDHCDGRRFFNPWPQGRLRDWKAGLKFFLETKRPVYRPLPSRGGRPPAAGPAGGLRVTWVGHATTLVQFDGLNLLTDPIWSERCSPVSWLGPRRCAPPGVAFDDLPPIHAVLLSHNHYDSLDRATFERLHRVHHPRFFVPLGNARLLESWGLDAVSELDWWESEELAGAEVHCVPAQHFSSRTLWDRDQALWSGWVVARGSLRFYFAGDSGYSPLFKEIGDRLGPFTLAEIPIGAYDPRAFMGPMHMQPEESVLVHRDVRAKQSLAIHFNTFRLTLEPQDEPPLRLRRSLAENGLPESSFWVFEHGEGREAAP